MVNVQACKGLEGAPLLCRPMLANREYDHTWVYLRLIVSSACSRCCSPYAYLLVSCHADLLLSCYVELHGRALSLMVHRSVAATNWLQHMEPRAPRPICDLLVQRLSKAETEAVKLVEATGRSGGMLPSPHVAINTSLCSSSQQMKL